MAEGRVEAGGQWRREHAVEYNIGAMLTALQRRHARLERQRLVLLERLATYTDAQHAFQPDPAPRWARATFRLPRIGWVTATGGLRFLEAHCDHHSRQIERILTAEGFPR